MRTLSLAVFVAAALAVSVAERALLRGSDASGPLVDLRGVLGSFRLPTVPGPAAEPLGAASGKGAALSGVGSFAATAAAMRAAHAAGAPDLAASCPGCQAFTRAMMEVVEHAVQPHDSGKTAEQVNALNRGLCARVLGKGGKDAPLEQIEACEDVQDMYGLDHVKVLMRHAPALLCEPLRSCGRFALPDAVAGGGAAPAVTGAGGDLLLQTGVPGALASLGINAAAMEQQQMLQGQRMREQEMREMDSLLSSQVQQKLLAAQERNKNLREQLRHIQKEAYRNQPGHCDCCDGCLTPGQDASSADAAAAGGSAAHAAH